MRALFVCQPAYGHFHPLVPLAMACEEAGHDVAFAVSPSFVPIVEAAGFEALPAGLDWLEHDPEATFAEAARLSTIELGRFLFMEVFLDHAAAAMVGDLPGVAGQWGADLLVHECYEFGTPLAAEQVGLPCVTVDVGETWPREVLAAWYGPALGRIRADLGMAEDPGFERYCGGLRLACFPPPFEVAASPDATPLRPVPYDGPGGQVPTVGGGPVVLVTFGTVFAKRAAEALQAVLDGLAGADVEVVTALGPARWVPVGAAAHVADLVIGHGGWGTTMAAVCAGKPSLMLPQAGDQFDNAFRIEATGAGLRLLPHAVDPGTVRRAVSELLDDPLYFANAQRLRRSIEAMPGPADLVPVLAALT